MLHFDPETGLYSDDTAVIRADVAAAWSNAMGKTEEGVELDDTPGSPMGQLIDSQTALVASKDREVLYLSNQFNPAVNEGIWQSALGQLYFMDRLGGAPTLVECLCAGRPGTLVQGTVKATTGHTLVTVTPTLIPEASSVLVPFKVTVDGPVVIPAGSVDTIVTTVPGWDTVTNPEPGVQGRDIETPREFEARRVASVAKNSQGRAASIQANIANIPGVIDSIVLENETGAPVVKFGVTIPTSSFWITVAGGAPEDIGLAIYQKKDGGAGTAGNTSITVVPAEYPQGSVTYNYEIPSPLGITITVTIKASQTTPSDIDVRIIKAVTDTFYGRGETDRVRMATTLYASLFYSPIMGTGVESLESVTLNIGAGEVNAVDINADKLPNLVQVLVTVRP